MILLLVKLTLALAGRLTILVVARKGIHQCPSASRKRSASIAAMHPAPEAVIACL